jgi:predicted nucleic acid-binding protein
MREHPILPAWLEIQAPSSIPLTIANARLDAGETEALALALDVHANAVLIDERLGRRIAAALGLHPTGVLGCLVLAKRNGYLPAVAPIVAELQSIAGCWFDDALIAAVLRAAGEAT